MLGSSEGAWTNMLASGNGQAFDVNNSPGEWHNNGDFKRLHSHNSGSDMDDRFDFQFVSGEFVDGEEPEYISGSYHVFGNDGTHSRSSTLQFNRYGTLVH